MASGQQPADYCGDAWADWFAKLAAQARVLPRVVHDADGAKLSDAKCGARLAHGGSANAMAVLTSSSE